MHAERDHLRHHVFPRLEEALRARHCHFEPIDLRIGVPMEDDADEESRELLVLKVCLDEVNRSRPFMLALLGDRYGWIPPRARLATAASEQGGDVDADGMSVTALEIEFGLRQRHAADGRRRLFYFRDPLPYAEMSAAEASRYSDEWSSDEAVRDGHRRLVELKKRLQRDLGAAGEIRHYTACWDPIKHRVTGLEAWGEMVYQDLLEVLTENVHTTGSSRDDELMEFIERHSRGFVGRSDLIRDLRTQIGSSDDRPLSGVCYVGSAGAGKSALIAKLALELQSQGVIVLLHAAGAREEGMDRVLRRWTSLLTSTAPEIIADDSMADSDEALRTFAATLVEASASRRIVILLDALDQLEATASARQLRWLPPQARNVFVVITSRLEIGGNEQFWPAGIEIKELPPLTAAESRQITEQIWGRYHRACPVDLIEVLLGKHADGQPAAANALWLTAAANLLNLLDEDDFALAEAGNAGATPERRLHQLLLDVASALPPDVPGLYGAVFDRAARQHGAAWVWAFIGLIYWTRMGLREADLRILLPQAAACLDPGATTADVILKLHTLRRAFRGHIEKQGGEQWWNFSHAQVRRLSVFERIKSQFGELALMSMARAAHERFRSLPQDDLIRESEFLHSAMAVEAYDDAAAWLGAKHSIQGEHWLNVTLEQLCPDPSSPGSERRMQSLLSSFRFAGLDDMGRKLLARRFCVTLPELLEHHGRRGAAAWLLERAVAVADEQSSDLGSPEWLTLVGALAETRLIEHQIEMGAQSDEWLPRLDSAEGRCERLTTGDENAMRTSRLLETKLSVLKASVLDERGDGAAATRQAEKALAVLEALLEKEADGQMRSVLRRELLMKIADVFRSADDPRSLELYRQSVEASEQGIAYDAGAKFQLATSLQRYGSALLAAQRADEAVAVLRRGRSVFVDIVRSSPAEFYPRRNLATLVVHLGRALLAQGDARGACEALAEAVTICQDLLDTRPDDPERIVELCEAQSFLGGAKIETGELTQAAERLKGASVLAARLLRLEFKPGEQMQRLSLVASGLECCVARETNPAARGEIFMLLCEVRAAMHYSGLGDEITLEYLMQARRNESFHWDSCGDLAHAESALRKAVQDPENSRQHAGSRAMNEWCESWKTLGELHLRQKNYEAALDACTHAIKVAEAGARAHEDDAALAANVAHCWQNLGVVQNEAGDSLHACESMARCHAAVQRMRARGMPLNAKTLQMEAGAVALQLVLGQLSGSGGSGSEPARPLETSASDAKGVPTPAPDDLRAMLDSGRSREVIDQLQPALFARGIDNMCHELPLDLRLAYIQALWHEQNSSGVTSFLAALPEQDDPRVIGLRRLLEEWKGRRRWWQRLGIGRDEPLPWPLPPLGNTE